MPTIAPAQPLQRSAPPAVVAALAGPPLPAPVPSQRSPHRPPRRVAAPPLPPLSPEARERRTPPNASLAPPVDDTGDRVGINPEAPIAAGSPAVDASPRSDVHRLQESIEGLQSLLARRALTTAETALLRHWQELLDAAREREAVEIPPSQGMIDRTVRALEHAARDIAVGAGLDTGARDSDSETRIQELPAGWSVKGGRLVAPGAVSQWGTTLAPVAPLPARRASLPSDRPTVAGGVAPRESPTLGSAGEPSIEARIMMRYAALVDAAEAAHLAVDHCSGSDCWQGAESSDVCECTCDGCSRATVLYEQARHEIAGPLADDENPRLRQVMARTYASQEERDAAVAAVVEELAAIARAADAARAEAERRAKK